MISFFKKNPLLLFHSRLGFILQRENKNKLKLISRLHEIGYTKQKYSVMSNIKGENNVKGFIDNINSEYISGWCFDESNLEEAVIVELFINNDKIAEKKAELHRRGMFEDKTHPTGNIGFNFAIEKDLLDENSNVSVKIKDSLYEMDTAIVFERFKMQYILEKNSTVKGLVDNININYISGWCYNKNKPEEPVTVTLYVNGVPIAEEIADIHRRGMLEEKMHLSGNVGFNFPIEERLLDENSLIEIKSGDNTINAEVALARFKENMFFLQLGKESYIRKKKRCILHVGMHKTGSSSIQENLYHKKNNINFSYFDLGIANHSVPIFTLFTDFPKANDYMNKMGYDEAAVDAYKKEVDDKIRRHLSLNYDYETFILSGESISILSKNALDELKAYLLTFFEEIKVVAYVRSPIAYINSVFQERVKAGLGDFYALHMLYPRYNHKLYKFDLVFGEENVALRYFNKDDLKEGDVTIDFLETNQLEVKNRDFIVTNESLSLESITLLYVYYKFGRGYGTGEQNRMENNRLLESLQKFGSGKMKITKNVLDTLINNNREDINWVEQRLGMSILDETYYPSEGEGIKSEYDLIEIAKQTTEALKEYIGEKVLTEKITGTAKEDTVALVEALRTKVNKKKLNIQSRVGHINKNAVRGWCFNEDQPLNPVMLELFVNGVKISETLAKDYRVGLLKNDSHPTGDVGFRFDLEHIVLNENSDIEVRVKGTDNTLDIVKAKEEFDLFLQYRNVIYLNPEIKQRRKYCIVHVGMHKTGSTSIQEKLYRNKNKNFSYFDLGRKNHSIPIFSLFTDVPENYHVHLSMGLTKRHIYRYNIEVDEMFREHIQKNPLYETFVISGEDICVLSENALKDFKNYLHMFFEEVKIVAYVRSPISYMNSAFQQVVKEGRMKFSVESIYPKYRFKIEKFDTVFGKENVSLNLFSRDALIDGDVTVDFLEKNHLEVSHEDIVSSNESLSLEAVALLYVYYILGPGRQGADTLIESLKNFGDEKLKLGKDVLQPIFDEKFADINWIETRMQLKLMDEFSQKGDYTLVNSEEDLIRIARNSVAMLRTYMGNKVSDEKIRSDSVKDIIALLKIMLQNSKKDL